jgi:hypothetical protein
MARFARIILTGVRVRAFFIATYYPNIQKLPLFLISCNLGIRKLSLTYPHQEKVLDKPNN